MLTHDQFDAFRQYFYYLMNVDGDALNDAEMLFLLKHATQNGLRPESDVIADILSQFNAQQAEFRGELIDAIDYEYQNIAN